ncbi:MAG: Asp-tRNA(Asn)/Glu-tRNA(Gln) amidotransferase subunit GatC [Proteobacteria bacterium]|nr:Asp-tRNA(Asn)/Glu-tRNA(Gln) amidotransferase subunit GatC [Pseudomonadota bacterium]
MSTIDIDLVARLADLSRLEFSEAEKKTLQGEIGRILDFISVLEEVNTDGVSPMSSTMSAETTRAREDVVTEEDKRDAYLKIAPASEMGFYVVPRVVE